MYKGMKGGRWVKGRMGGGREKGQRNCAYLIIPH